MQESESKADVASRQYTGAAGREYHEGKRGLAPSARDWVMELRAEKFQSHIQPEDVVFELGVGAGWNLGKLRCGRKIGSDAADFLAAPVRAAGIEFLPDSDRLPDAFVQVALCHHTLEHLAAPLATLHELRRLLEPGGKLLLHVPWERESRCARYRPDEPNHHLYSWNAQTLGNLVALAGFQVEQVGVRRYGYDRLAANLAVKLHLGAAGFRQLRAMMILVRPLWEVEMLARRP